MSYTPELSNFVYVPDTTKVDGRFVALLALETTVLAAGTVCRSSGSTLTAMPIPAGATVYGYFTSVQLTSGKVLAYIS